MKELAATQFVHVSFIGFIKDQLLFNAPFLPVWLSGLICLYVYKPFKKWVIFGIAYFTLLLILIFFKAKSYYTLGIYPVLLAFGSVALEQFIYSTTKKWILIPLFIIISLLGTVSVFSSLPILSIPKEVKFIKTISTWPGLEDINRWENGNHYDLPQDFADMLGWKEIGTAAGKLWDSLPDKEHTIVYCENYGQAAAVGKYGKPYKLRNLISYSDQYRFWLPDSISSKTNTFIYINDELGEDMPGYFNSIELAWQLKMPWSRSNGTQIYICKEPNPSFFRRMNDLIALKYQ